MSSYLPSSYGPTPSFYEQAALNVCMRQADMEGGSHPNSETYWRVIELLFDALPEDHLHNWSQFHKDEVRAMKHIHVIRFNDTTGSEEGGHRKIKKWYQRAFELTL